jgi:hypothetical protein
MNCTSGHSWTLAPRPRVLPNKAEFHGFCIDRIERACQIFYELVGSGKADFGIPDAKNGKTLQQADGIRHGYIDVRLLHSVAQTGVKQLDFSGLTFRHIFLLQIVNLTFQ